MRIPHCRHGNIILGCPDDSCPDQNEYLAEQRAAQQRYEDQLQENVRVYVRTLLGLPL